MNINIEPYLGKFVTAKLKGENDCRQGWVISADPFIIEGQTGTKYECEELPVIVKNPPKRTWRDQ